MRQLGWQKESAFTGAVGFGTPGADNTNTTFTHNSITFDVRALYFDLVGTDWRPTMIWYNNDGTDLNAAGLANPSYTLIYSPNDLFGMVLYFGNTTNTGLWQITTSAHVSNTGVSYNGQAGRRLQWINANQTFSEPNRRFREFLTEGTTNLGIKVVTSL